MSTNFIQKGTELIKQAVLKDNKGEYTEALKLYSQGIEYLMTGLKYERNTKVIHLIKEKVKKFLKRAETIKLKIEEISLNDDEYIKKSETKTKHIFNEEIDKESEHLVFGYSRMNEKLLKNNMMTIPNEIIYLFLKYYYIFPYEFIENPNVKWDDVVGLQSAKMSLKERFILPLKFPMLFTGKRRPFGGVMLYGPKGCGKTHLINAVATESGATVFHVSLKQFKYRYDGEKIVKSIFERARNRTPCIVCLDGVQHIMSRNYPSSDDRLRRMKTEILVQMEGVGVKNKELFTITTTDKPWDLDPAIRRRFCKRIYIKLPDLDDRKNIFKMYIDALSLQYSLSDNDYDIVSEKTNGFTAYDIYCVVSNVLMMQNKNKRKDLVKVDKEMDIDEMETCEQEKIMRENVLVLADFVKVIDGTKSSIKKELIKRYQDWTEEFGQEG